jgi:hypothetical protein
MSRFWQGWQERGSGTVQWAALLTIEAAPQLLSASPVASRLAPLKGLDPPELARLTSKERPSVLGGQDA